MPVATLQKAIEDMEHGVYDFTKDGKCSGCGQCCSDILPISEREIKDIKRYMKKKHIKLSNNNVLGATIDLTCPFLDATKAKDKCKIYPVRPHICRMFICNVPPSKVETNRELFWKRHYPVSMREVFKEDGGE